MNRVIHATLHAWHDVRRYPWFYLLSGTFSAAVLWTVAAAPFTTVRKHNDMTALLKRAVIALEEDNRLDAERQP